ncbi:MAG: nucleoside monophosphate kinase [alpha proteobacterium HIMB59]|nr:MAG: nucleoside monophosphate kinase [alpha proteobacterium HIMB59]|tara:strand:+ start:4700 stop:5254 length:555 start_codon:yes stop_codon:yes gene_type:complete
MVIVFIGPPGSGKGTQAQILKDTKLPNLHLLTVSSLLKEKSSDGSILGDEIKQKMDNGDLIEDTIVISVLKEKVEILKNEQLLIDGYPRSSVQAIALKDIFNEDDINVINFTVSDQELLQRIKKRSQEESRADDSVFEKRLGIYKQSHAEIINSLSQFYEVIDIDANNEISHISQKIVEKLGLN